MPCPMDAQTTTSAGLLMYRLRNRGLEVFLAHPGGPYFRGKDRGAWSIPKGETEPGSDLLAAARREFEEETGLRPPAGGYLDLGEVRQRGGKRVVAWAFEGEWEAGRAPASNTFELEWPPRSGGRQTFPEIDQARFFDPATAREKINPAQAAFIDRLQARLD